MKRHGYTLVELMVTLIVAAIAVGMAWDVFAQGQRQVHFRFLEADSLQRSWLENRGKWRWGEGPDSLSAQGDSSLFR